MSSIFDSTKTNSSSGGSGVGGFNLVRTATNYTALSLDLIEADVTAGPITITAPASGMFTVVDIVKLAGTNNITISRTAGIKINGVDSDYVLNKLGSNFFFVYDETNQNWFVQDNSEQITDFVSQEYTGVATAGQTTITPGFTWKTAFTGKALFISGVKQAPNSYTVNSIGGGLSSQITLSEALVGGETIEFTALDVSSVPSLQGIVDTLALQPTQITNAGFGVWSNGTLESAASSINLITNGEFETDTSGWAAGNGATLTRDTTTFANGAACLKITNSGATYGAATWAASTVVGRVYKVKCFAKIGTATSAFINIGTTPLTNDVAQVSGLSASFAVMDCAFEAVSTTTHIGLFNNNTSGGTGYYDSVTLCDMGAKVSVTNISSGVCTCSAAHGIVVGRLVKFTNGSNAAVAAKLYEVTTVTDSTHFTLNDTSVNPGATSSTSCTEVTVGCVDYNTKALDLWTKDLAACCWRETINTKAGAYYAMRVYNGSLYWSDGGRAAKPEFCARYAGRTAALGMWVRCSSANKARIGITDSDGTTWSDYHSGGGTYEWLEVTRTPGIGITSFNVVVDSGTGTEAQFSQPQLMFGTSVGLGNFVPIPNEFINFDAAAVTSAALHNIFQSTRSGVITGTCDLSGAIPRGSKALQAKYLFADSGSFSGAVNATIGTNEMFGLLNLYPNSSQQNGAGRIRLNSLGQFSFGIVASGTNTFYTQLMCTGVQL